MVCATAKSTIPSTSNSSGKIIVLAGTSCAGKSSVCRELVKILENSQSVHFDNYFCLGKNNSLLRAEQLVIEEALRLASQGKVVICDTIIRGKAGETLHKKAFGAKDTSFVLIYCPFEELLQRAKGRNQLALKNGNQDDLRSLEYIQWLFLDYYQPSHEHDKSIGVLHHKDVLNQASDFHKKNSLDSFLKIKLQGKELKQVILEKMDLENRESVGLKPVASYDLIVDNGRGRNPKDCALDVKSFLGIE